MFEADVVVDIDSEIDVKLKIADINVCQVYEWLPYTYGELDSVPADPKERFSWLKDRGENISFDTTDEEINALEGNLGYAVRYARTAVRFRKELIEKYGEERGSKIRYAEAYQLCEYGKQLTPETMKEYFPF